MGLANIIDLIINRGYAFEELLYKDIPELNVLNTFDFDIFLAECQRFNQNSESPWYFTAEVGTRLIWKCFLKYPGLINLIKSRGGRKPGNINASDSVTNAILN